MSVLPDDAGVWAVVFFSPDIIRPRPVQAGESDQAKQAVQGQLHSVFTIQGCSVPRSSRDALLTNQRAPGAGSDQSEALIVFCLRLSAVAGRPLGCLAWTGHQH